jgi:uncharacterized protein YfaT (DUF1175 family)
MKEGGVTITSIRMGLRRAQRCVEWARSGLVVKGCVAVALPDELHRSSMGRIRNWLVCWMVEQGVPHAVATSAKWHARECTRMERLAFNGVIPSRKLA